MKMKTSNQLIRQLAICAGFTVSSISAADYINFIVERPVNGNAPSYMEDIPQQGEASSVMPVLVEGTVYELWSIRSDGSQSWLLDEKFVGAYSAQATLSIVSPDPFEGDDAGSGTWKRTRADIAYTITWETSGLLPESELASASEVELVHEFQSNNGELTEFGSTMIGDNEEDSMTLATVIPAEEDGKSYGIETFSIYAQPENPEDILIYKINNGHGNNVDGVDSSNDGASKEGEDTDSSVDDEIKLRISEIIAGDPTRTVDLTLDRVQVYVFPVPEATITTDSTENVFGADFPNVSVTAEDLYPGSTTFVRLITDADRSSLTGFSDQDVTRPSISVLNSYINPSDDTPITRDIDLTGWEENIIDSGKWWVQVVHQSPVLPNQDEILAEYTFDVLPKIRVNAEINTLE